jgi:ribosomal protein S12 methylthiotransferase accessory factor
MDIGIVGTGPATHAIEAALGDVDADAVRTEAARLDEFDFGFVVGDAGTDAFDAATRAADDWVAVELGGMGGRAFPDVEAAVSVFAEGTGCYHCLRRRVDAGADAESDEESGSTTESDAEGGAESDPGTARYAGAVAARRGIQQFSEGGRAGTVVDLSGRERTLLPVPGCRCDPGRNPTLALHHDDVSLEVAIAKADRAVDGRLGVVSQVGEQESFPLPYYLAQTADTTSFSAVRAAEFAAGADVDWDRAYMKALGEALERYAAGVYTTDEFRQATAASLDGTVPANRFVRPEGYAEQDSDAPRYWAMASNLETGTGAWLPAELVHYPPPEERIRPGITTGLGLGNSTIEAVLSGLYEVVERDATMLGWYSTFDPLGLTVEDETLAELEKRAKSEDLSVSLSLVTQDVDVPVVAAAVHREGGAWPTFAMGSGCDLDPVAAARSAASEALQNWVELRGMGREQAAAQSAAIGEYADFPEAAREFTEFEATVHADHVAGDAAELTGDAALTTVVDRVAAANLDVYAARVTPRDVEALGFEAVRVVSPDAQPLFTGEPFFGDRLGRVASSMGFEARPDRDDYHPFP